MARKLTSPDVQPVQMTQAHPNAVARAQAIMRESDFPVYLRVQDARTVMILNSPGQDFEPPAWLAQKPAPRKRRAAKTGSGS